MNRLNRPPTLAEYAMAKKEMEANSIVGVRHSLSKREYWEMSIRELEDLIKKHLDIEDIEIIADEELHNGYTPVSARVAEDHTADIKDYIKGDQWSMALYSWIEHLIFLNILPKGNYLIDHSW